jgi:ATP-dependent DNA ligase
VKHEPYAASDIESQRQAKLDGATHVKASSIEALVRLRSNSCIIDGEAVACGDDGISSFDRIRYRQHDATGLAQMPRQFRPE